MRQNLSAGVSTQERPVSRSICNMRPWYPKRGAMRFRPAVYRELLKPPSPPTEAQIRTEDLKQTFAEYGDLLKSNRAPANASLRLPLSNSQRQVNSSLDVASYLAVSPGTNRSTEPYRCDQDQ